LRIRFSPGFAPPAALAAAVGLWAVATAAVMMAEAWLGIMIIFVLPVWALGSLVLLVVCFAVGVRRLSRGALLLAPAMIGLAVALMVVAPPLGVRLRFLLERPAYDAALAQLSGGFSVLPQGSLPAGVFLRIDAGPPRRVAFSWGGMGDNWAAVVWDPTDVVATARGWDREPGRYTASPRAKKLFGGDLVGCLALGDHYYHCGFT